jgi:hypothetical protein
MDKAYSVRNGGIIMKKKLDLLYAVLMILFLFFAYFIKNSIVQGISLLLFSVILAVNTAIKLKTKLNNKFRDKFFYGILLFLDIVLAASALFVIITAIIEV